MNETPIFKCFICEHTLIEELQDNICSYCGKREKGDWICPNHHYICEACRTSLPIDVINTVIMNTKMSDPWEIATLVMKHPMFPPHGIPHHLLVAPSILVSLLNSNQIEFSRENILLALKRTLDIPLGVCGSRGDCGACVGAGAAVSMILKANYNSDRERVLTLKATANALLEIAGMGGHRCCKQSVYASIKSCISLLENELNFHLTIKEERCQFSKTIQDCKKENCPFYRG